MDERELLRHIAELPREIEPAADPWPAIAARIDAAERAGARRTPAATAWRWRAAAAMLVVALAAGLMFGPRQGGDAPTAPAESVAVAPAAGHIPVPASLAASEAEYRAAFREFITVGRARQVLAPQAVEGIEAGWAEMRATEDALAAALAESPENAFLAARMMELRARQLGFLQQLAALDHDYRRLTT